VDFRLSLDFFDSGLYTRTAVARLTLALAKLSCSSSQQLHFSQLGRKPGSSCSALVQCRHWKIAPVRLVKTDIWYVLFSFTKGVASSGPGRVTGLSSNLSLAKTKG